MRGTTHSASASARLLRFWGKIAAYRRQMGVAPETGNGMFCHAILWTMKRCENLGFKWTRRVDESTDLAPFATRWTRHRGVITDVDSLRQGLSNMLGNQGQFS